MYSKLGYLVLSKHFGTMLFSTVLLFWTGSPFLLPSPLHLFPSKEFVLDSNNNQWWWKFKVKSLFYLCGASYSVPLSSVHQDGSFAGQSWGSGGSRSESPGGESHGEGHRQAVLSFLPAPRKWWEHTTKQTQLSKITTCIFIINKRQQQADTR